VAPPVSWARLVFETRDGGRVVITIEGEKAPDLDVVAALARVELLCRRSGTRVHLEEMSPLLEELLELSGLLGQVGRQPERCEETLGVEKEVDSRDAVT
jgi:hypothetical protein